MDTLSLRDFLKWCTIINIVILLFSSIMFMLAADFIYDVHGLLFHMNKEAFDIVIYSLLGGYKVIILVFNFIPYVALRIIG